LSAITLALVASSTAQARPRDEVMSGAFHCAAIGDSRIWLDCYYGAAQPERAALGLQSAPPGQVNLILNPSVGNTPPQNVEVRDQVLSSAFQCNQVTDDRQWLNCYYAAAQPMRAVLGLSPGPQAAMKPSQTAVVSARAPSPIESPQPESKGLLSELFGAPNKVPEKKFGLSATPEPDLAVTVDHIDARMASYRFDKFSTFTVTLVNGQVWRQLPGDINRPHWVRPAASYEVLISRGFLGSYNFRVKGNPGMFKVRRVQ